MSRQELGRFAGNGAGRVFRLVATATWARLRTATSVMLSNGTGGRITRPSSVAIDITSACNLRCRHCYVYRQETTPYAMNALPQLSDEEWVARLRQLRAERPSIALAVWIGGEPLLRPTLLRRGVAQFPFNWVFTNGTLPIPEAMPSATTFFVSLDGTAQEHDAIRGPGTYEQVRATISETTARLYVHTVLNRVNASCIEPLLAEWHGTSVRGVKFSLYTPEWGVDDASWAWGSALADLNNDGWLDIYVANGWTRGKDSADYCATLWSGVMDGMQRANTASASLSTDLERLRPFLDGRGNLDIDLAQVPKIGAISWDGYNRNRCFINPGDEARRFVSIEESPVILDDISRTVATGDLDNDGDVDLVVVSTTCPVRIFRNDSPAHHWLKVALEERHSNRSAIGAQVIVRAARREFLRAVASGSGYNAHHSLELEFGLGSLAHVEAVEIRWPSNRVQTVPNPPVDSRLAIREPVGSASGHDGRD